MDQRFIGRSIRTLRKEKNLTQQQLANALGVTAQAVSKWERSLGCPDIPLLSSLAECFSVPIEALLSDGQTVEKSSGTSLHRHTFFFCPQCGNPMFAPKHTSISCCGKMLEGMTASTPEEDHRLQLAAVEDEWYLTASHPMEKGHYIAFVALVSGDRLLLRRCWPEWELQLRLPRREHGFLYWYCTRHGLFRQAL